MPVDWEELRKRQQEDAYRKRAGLPPRETIEAAEERKRHGELRHAMHEGHSTHRPLSRDYDIIGIAGEQAFADFMGVEWDRSLRPGGTNNINFRIAGKTINVATARYPKYLLVETGKAKAGYYVLAMYREHLPAKLLGWATRQEVMATVPKDIGKRGIVSYHIPWEDLADMDALRDILKPPPIQESLI